MAGSRDLFATAGMVIALLPVGFSAAGAGGADPFDLEQEVTSATLRSQPLSDVPAAVTVISREDIRTFGFLTLAEALASARGFFITSDRNYHYAGTRGFGPLGDWGSRVLVMIDGQPLVGSVYRDSPLGRDFPVDMAAVERIEIVRGPGSTLYGTNAVFGIINVVTGRAGNATGPVAGLGLGSDNRGWGFLEMGNGHQGDWHWFVQGSGFGGRGPDLYVPALDAPPASDGWARGADGDRGATLVAGATRPGWEFHAAVGQREKLVPTGAYETVFNTDQTWTRDGWGLLSLQHLRRLDARTAIQGRLSLSRAGYKGQYLYEAEDGDTATSVSRDQAEGNVVGLDLRAYLEPVPSLQAVVGVEGQRHVTARQKSWNVDPFEVVQETNDPSTHGAAYGQFEWRAGPSLSAHAGVRAEQDAHFGGVSNPRVGLVWRPGPRWTFKALSGRAFRAPNLYELFYTDGETERPNPDLVPETVWATQVSAQMGMGPGMLFSLIGFHNALDNWIGITADSLDGMYVYHNQGSLTVAGMEAELEGRGPVNARWRLSYTFADAGSGAARPPNFAAHAGQASLAVPLPALRGRAGLLFRAVGPRLNYAGERVPGYGLVDLTLTASPATDRLGLSFSLKNLLDQDWADPGGEEHSMTGIPGDGRVAQFQVRYGL